MSKATVWVYPPMPQQKFFADTAFSSSNSNSLQMISYPSPLIYSNVIPESIKYGQRGIAFRLEDGSVVNVVHMPYIVQVMPDEVKNIETV